jgi:DNA-binding NtrC family response regulator
LRRAQLVSQVLRGAKVLWIDDHPENNLWERRLFEVFDATCVTVETTRSAIACLQADSFDLIISDIARSSSTREGVDVLPSIRTVAPRIPILFYVGQLTESTAPMGAQGIAAEPNELLHLVLDQLERRRI